MHILKQRQTKVFLTLALGLQTVLGGCAPSKEQEPVSIIVKVPTLKMVSISNPDISDSQAFLELAAKKYIDAHPDSNIDISIEVFDYIDEVQAITQSYGTSDAADVLYEGYFNMTGYISDGMLAPIDDIISPDIRADISDASWKASSLNEKTYMLPYLSMQNIIIYNRKLLNECGLEEFTDSTNTINNWSLEEWEYILNTLAEKLPEDIYPMSMFASNNQGDTHTLTLLRCKGSSIYDEEGNFDFSSEKSLEGLEFLRSGVENEWYPPHCENLEMKDCHQLFEAGRLAIYIFNNANFVLYDNVEEDYGFVNFPGNLATSFITGFGVFNNQDEKRLALAKDFVRFIYEDEELMDLSAGNLPESRKVQERYKDQIAMLSEFTENSENVWDFMNGSANWQGKNDSFRSVFWTHIHDFLAGIITAEECASRLDADCNKAIHSSQTDDLQSSDPSESKSQSSGSITDKN